MIAVKRFMLVVGPKFGRGVVDDLHATFMSIVLAANALLCCRPTAAAFFAISQPKTFAPPHGAATEGSDCARVPAS